MNLIAITGPELPVTLEEMKAHLRVDGTDDDDLIEAYISAAADYIEDPRGRYGYALAPRTWELALDAFPEVEIELPAAPVASVTSILYTDEDGAEQTVSASDYEVDTYSYPSGWVVPSEDWPETMETINAVRVRWVAGVGAPIKAQQAIRLLVGHWYASREASGPAKQEIPFAVTSLLASWRRWVLA